MSYDGQSYAALVMEEKIGMFEAAGGGFMRRFLGAGAGRHYLWWQGSQAHAY
jgi:hypothetical protein